jgi:hypothetical protein
MGNKMPTGENTPPSAQPHSDKDQLRRRVETRVAELQAALAQMQGQEHNKERILALQTELQIVADAVSGGWEHVGAMEALHLSKWLASTELLVLGSVVPGAPQGPAPSVNAETDASAPEPSPPVPAPPQDKPPMRTN